MELFLWPQPTAFLPLPEAKEGIPDALLRSLVAAIESYNAGIYAAATVAGRRTLEGIFKYRAPVESRQLPLHRLIEEAKNKADLAESLERLSHAIRSGGNLGAHFDMEKEPDERLAREIVELVSYLVAYFYTLPAKIDLLEKALDQDEGRDGS